MQSCSSGCLGDQFTATETEEAKQHSSSQAYGAEDANVLQQGWGRSQDPCLEFWPVLAPTSQQHVVLGVTEYRESRKLPGVAVRSRSMCVSSPVQGWKCPMMELLPSQACSCESLLTCVSITPPPTHTHNLQGHQDRLR